MSSSRMIPKLSMKSSGNKGCKSALSQIRPTCLMQHLSLEHTASGVIQLRTAASAQTICPCHHLGRGTLRSQPTSFQNRFPCWRLTAKTIRQLPHSASVTSRNKSSENIQDVPYNNCDCEGQDTSRVCSKLGALGSHFESSVGSTTGPPQWSPNGPKLHESGSNSAYQIGPRNWNQKRCQSAQTGSVFGNRFGSRKTEPKTDQKPEPGCSLYMILYTLSSFAAPSLWAARSLYFGSQKTEPFCGAEASILVPKNGTDLVPEIGTRITTRRRGF